MNDQRWRFKKRQRAILARVHVLSARELKRTSYAKFKQGFTGGKEVKKGATIKNKKALGNNKNGGAGRI